MLTYLFAIFFGVAITCLYQYFAQEHTLLCAVDAESGMIARIVWAYDMLPFNTVKADLIIEPSGASHEVKRFSLLRTEDCEQIVEHEFPKIEIQKNHIKLFSIRKNYNGPLEFEY